jgi:haloalkane dehalogenase
VIGIRDHTFDGTFPFVPYYHLVNGFQMHYVDEGRGEPVVLLHGDPTWGYLYRHFIPRLARRRRCIVPDHVGMGKSETPTDPAQYRLAQHVANLESLLLGLDVHDITLVVHDWGGPVGLGFATRHPDRIKRLVLLNTWAFAPWPGGPFPRLIDIVRSDRGEAFVLKKNAYLEPALVGTTFHRENLTTEVMEAYQAPFPSPESRLALLCWSRDIPVQEADVSFAEMTRIERGLAQFAEIPVLLVWGMKDPVLTETVLRRWQRVYPRALSCEIEDASHFLQEDAPEQIVDSIQEFLEMHP